MVEHKAPKGERSDEERANRAEIVDADRWITDRSYQAQWILEHPKPVPGLPGCHPMQPVWDALNVAAAAQDVVIDKYKAEARQRIEGGFALPPSSIEPPKQIELPIENFNPWRQP